MSEVTPLLEVDLGLNGGKQIFFNSSEIDLFFKAEESFWLWLQNARSKDQGLATIYSQVSFAYVKVKAHLENFKSAELNKQPSKDYLNNIKNIFNAYIEKRTLHSSTIEAKYCKEVYDRLPKVGGYVVSHFLGETFRQGFINSNEWVLSLSEYSRFISGELDKVNPSFLESSNELIKKYSDNVQEISKELATIKQNNITFTLSTETLISGKTKEFDTKFSELDETVKQKTIHIETELKNIKDTYDKKLALQSSVQYWNSRKRWSYSLCIVLGVLIVILMYNLGSYSKDELEKVLNIKEEEVINSKLAFSALLILAFIGIWLIRILVKLFMSYIHAAKDASERIVLLKTYLAMSREGQLDDAQKKVITTVLFRPNLTEIGKEDGIPPSFWDIATRNR